MYRRRSRSMRTTSAIMGTISARTLITPSRPLKTAWLDPGATPARYATTSSATVAIAAGQNGYQPPLRPPGGPPPRPLKTAWLAPGATPARYATTSSATVAIAADQNGYQPPLRPPGAPPSGSGRAPPLVSNMATAATTMRTAAV